MIILGANFGFDFDGKAADNGASALLVDDRIEAAIAEERVSREKHAGGFCMSSQRVLELAGKSLHDVDLLAISFYQHPSDGKDESAKLVRSYCLRHWGIAPPLYMVRSHHRSHAATAFFQSPFERALICVWDNEGSIIGCETLPQMRRSERHSYYLGERGHLRLIGTELDGPEDVGFGQTYARFTSFVGLGNYTDAGKLMGLSALGDAARYRQLGPLWVIDSIGQLRSSFRQSEGALSVPLLFLRKRLAPPRYGDKTGYERQELRDLAAFVQGELERMAIARVQRLVTRTNAEAICIAGGVGLNCALNSRLQEAIQLPVYVPPHPDDTGQALGNVLLAYGDLSTARDYSIFRHSLSALGGAYPDDEIAKRVNPPLGSQLTTLTNAGALPKLANDLAAGQIVGWFQGRSEYGARALGFRSILADPRRPDMKDRLNRVKGREAFRPIAPIVTAEAASTFFDLEASPLWPTMSGAAKVRPTAVDVIPSAVHADGTARVQVLNRASHPLLHRLLVEFGGRTGVPVLLNTSFNTAGEPIVESPEQALQAALSMRLDILCVGNMVIYFLHA